MPTLDLTLRLRMIRRTACVSEAFFGKPVGKLLRHIRRTIVREDAWAVSDFELVEPRGLQSEVQRFLRCPAPILCATLK